ncbi:MAG: helix-turn-helix domain-containing protein [Methanolinea sp.]|jgi:hypothetical protein|nr:helix-turn-helix domain-containing protein [Methanolinea sp.]
MNERDCDIMVCDTMARKFLPAMRAEMVFRLVHQQGLSQSDAAKRLGITRAAVSQYLSRKRGDADFEISPDMNALIDRWAMAVAGNQDCITLCDICQCAMKYPWQQKKDLIRQDQEEVPDHLNPPSSATSKKGEEHQ